MIIDTTRFGEVEVDGRRVITFAKGILGFPQQKRYVLIETSDENVFFWLQSVDRPDLAFLVTDPSVWISSYRVPVKQDQLAELDLPSIEDTQVLVIVNKREHMLTGNLQGPLVINVANKQGAQLVLSDRRFTARAPLMELGSPLEALSA